MNFELNEDQRQLQDSVERVLAEHYSFEQRRAMTAAEPGHSPAAWKQLAALGVTGLTVDEAHGGFGGSAVDLLPVMQAFGKALLLEPFLASNVLGATALRLAGDAATQQRLLPGVASGELLLAWADDEAAARHAPLWTETRATRHGTEWLLDGSKINVLHAPAAHHFVVTARTDGAADAPAGRALFLVDAKANGLQVRAHRLIDDTPAGELTLRGVAATPLGDPTDGARAAAAIAGVHAAGIAAVCADMVGAMGGAYRLAVDYLNTRKQFGRLIGENQSLRHRAAEMLVSLETCRSMAIAAAVAVDKPDAESSQADLLRAKLLIGRHGRQLCQHAVQMHGGIGMTEEYAVGHYLRRVHVLDHLFGDADAQASRLGDLLG
ncbi:MAG: acyl-CoA dehydrogenase family protein [Burkholderiales bacterium]